MPGDDCSRSIQRTMNASLGLLSNSVSAASICSELLSLSYVSFLDTECLCCKELSQLVSCSPLSSHWLINILILLPGSSMVASSLHIAGNPLPPKICGRPQDGLAQSRYLYSVYLRSEPPLIPHSLFSFPLPPPKDASREREVSHRCRCDA